MPHGIELREYLQTQSHTYVTHEQAEALTRDLINLFPALIGHERMVLAPPSARESYPLNAKYDKPIITRLTRSRAQRDVQRAQLIMAGKPIPAWLTFSGFSTSTQNKHERVEEVEKMLDEIDYFRRLTGRVFHP